jgi:hypothetical protein
MSLQNWSGVWGCDDWPVFTGVGQVLWSTAMSGAPLILLSPCGDTLSLSLSLIGLGEQCYKQWETVFPNFFNAFFLSSFLYSSAVISYLDSLVLVKVF